MSDMKDAGEMVGILLACCFVIVVFVGVFSWLVILPTIGLMEVLGL